MSSFYFYLHMKKASPIGIFDSGVGGITIWHELVKKLPYENTLYLADNHNAPYGSKSASEVLSYSIKNTKVLLSKGVKLIVVACNTATTNTINILRREFPHIGFIGVEPAIKPAALLSVKKRIAVLATNSTLQSKEFTQALQNPFMEGIKVTKIAGVGLVPLIEENKLDSDEMHQLIRSYTQQMIEANIDCLVLGCTHYPYIKEPLEKALPENVKIIDSGEAVARQINYILKSKDLLNDQKKLGKHIFYYNKPSQNILHFIPKRLDTKSLYLDF